VPAELGLNAEDDMKPGKDAPPPLGASACQIREQPAGPGIARGQARVIHRPTDIARFKWYEIIVRMVLGSLAAAALFLTACTASLPSANIKGPSTYHHRMDVRTGGFQRAYRVHVPAGYDGTVQMPLVVVIHGAFDTAAGMEEFSGFSRLADREKFIVLYPEGIGILGYLQHWNAGHCCGKAADDRIDDVGYLAAAIDDACRRLSVDRQRIYMVGFSNGGMMTYRFAAEHTELLAAAAPIAASIGGRPDADAPQWRIPRPKKALPILVMHGLDDRDIPFEGGQSPHRGGDRTYISVPESFLFWVENNECLGSPVDSHTSGGTVAIQRWEPCKNGTAAVLITIDGWGHIWPGPYFTGKLPANDPLSGFDAAEIIWNFFKRFP
jgi:polyhydroxybutyrate depolymerase